MKKNKKRKKKIIKKKKPQKKAKRGFKDALRTYFKKLERKISQ